MKHVMPLQIAVDARHVVHKASLGFVETQEMLVRAQPQLREGICARAVPGMDFGFDVWRPQQIWSPWTSGYVLCRWWTVHIVTPAVVLGTIPATRTSAASLSRRQERP